MDEDWEVSKQQARVIVLIILVTITITFLTTKGIVEKQTQETVLENINTAYNECQQNCGFKKPAFTYLDGTGLDCICLEFADGDSTNSSI